MASDDEIDFDNDDDESKGKKGLVFVILALLILGGGGAGLYFSGLLEEFLPKDGEPVAAAPGSGVASDKKDGPSAIVYYELPHIVANLNPGSATPSFIKTTIAIEAPNQAVVTRLQTIQPKVMDIINTYVRELRPADLKGSAGIYRLRDELLLRINKALYPDKVNNVLFKEILIQ